MFKKLLKAVSAVLFIPIVISSTKAFFNSFDDLFFMNINMFFPISGFFAYPAFQTIFIKPMYIYSIGHEIVHVIATWICGGKVTSFNITQRGGEIMTTKNNVLIRLSPYFIPIHTIFLLFVFWIISKFTSVFGILNIFTFLVGFTMSFHIFMTIEVMKMRQPDIMRTGYIFSVLFIYTANIFILELVVSFLLKDISFIAYIKETIVLSRDMYVGAFLKVFT